MNKLLSIRHVPSLDGLRGFAVILVLLYHSQHYEISNKSLPVRVLGQFFAAGWVGVDIFFVLSGFLITGILLDTAESPHYFRNFYIRRLLRIFPLYYLVLLLSVVLSLLFAINWHGSGPYYFLLVQNYAEYSRLFLTGHTLSLHLEHLWSIAVEEQFYLFWPLLVWALRPRKYLVLVAVLMLLLCPVARSYAPGLGLSGSDIYLWTPFVLDMFAWGGLAAIVVRGMDTRLRERMASGMVLCALTAITYILAVRHGNFDKDDQLVAQIGFSAIGLLASGSILLLLNSRRWISKLFVQPLLRWFGRLSYGIYIFHYIFFSQYQSVRLWIIAKTHSEFLGALSVFLQIFLFGTLMAWISYNCYEKFWLRLKDKFPRSESVSASVLSESR